MDQTGSTERRPAGRARPSPGQAAGRGQASTVASGGRQHAARDQRMRLKVTSPSASPPARAGGKRPGRIALASASIRISLENTHGCPARTRDPRGPQDHAGQFFCAKRPTLRSTLRGDAIAPRIGASLPAVPARRTPVKPPSCRRTCTSSPSARKAPPGRNRRAGLELGGAIRIDDTRLGDGVLHGQVPVQQPITVCKVSPMMRAPAEPRAANSLRSRSRTKVGDTTSAAACRLDPVGDGLASPARAPPRNR